MFTALVPNVFYPDLTVGRDLFVDAIGMEVVYEDADTVVVARDACKLTLVENAALAAADRPALAIETDSIDEVYADVSRRRPDLLHPNPVVHTVTRRDWGAREFALLDPTHVCVVFRDWS